MGIIQPKKAKQKVMKYAIIAAGDGSRLAEEGLKCPKPLVEVDGECLVDRLIRIFMEHDAESIAIICNDKWPQVGAHLRKMQEKQLPLQIVEKRTPSSMHSLHVLHSFIGDGPFCLTTVDTVFREKEFAEYVDVFQQFVTQDGCDALMGVTDFVDDEKPLYVEVDDDMNITAFLDSSSNVKYVSGGIYGMIPVVWPILDECVRRGERRMRNFQRALIANGLRIKAFKFSKVLDVDHVADVDLANQFVKEP